MFCFQCEQTDKGTGCTVQSTCGKTPEVAALQDLLIHTLKGLSVVALGARRAGIVDQATDIFTIQALFATLTNVNFHDQAIAELIHSAIQHRESLKARSRFSPQEAAAQFTPGKDLSTLILEGEAVGIPRNEDPDLRSLKETLIYGLKGVAAYADHAYQLGEFDPAIPAFIYEGLAATLRSDLQVGEGLGLLLRCGEINLKAMELLDRGHTTRFGHPEPTAVPLGHRPGKAILISGHDLRDLEALLEQTAGRGIDVYTHGEMLPAHGYPGLKKKYPHLYGHFGTAWQNQVREFQAFPGPIVMTTNCLIRPRENYQGHLFTLNQVGWPGVTHLNDRNFSSVIEKALSLPGFTDTANGKTVLTGFARNAVLNVAGKVIDAVKAGKIRHFFLVGGCDGARPGRNYYTEFVEKVPPDCVVLTLACGKFRFFDKELGDIDGIPRLLDVGQCNDAYSAIQIALALAQAFNCGVNDLPLSLVLSWFEQKAVSILLTLLHLGIKGIRIGPTLPAFISPNVLKLLIETYDIKPIGTPEGDLKAILG